MNHMTALMAGFFLDMLLGDPHGFPHPVRWIGSLIAALEQRWNNPLFSEKKRLRNGILLTLVVLPLTVLLSGGILYAAYRIHPFAGVLAEAVMTWQLLAARCLKDESMKVYSELKKGSLEGARYAVSMIVGRDTEQLDEAGVTRAAVETVAENTSDGEIAPMLALAIGGPVLGFMYKAINTMDSMVGYKDERYLYFGRPAARLDDAVNYLPARISAVLMIVVSAVLEVLTARRGERGYSGSRAFRIWRRDRRKHASPNSAQTESVCAGALGVRLAGDSSYFGRIVHKPYIGDELRPIETEDIRRANVLMYGTSWLCLLLCLAGVSIIAAII